MIVNASNNPYFTRYAQAGDPDFRAIAFVAMLDVCDDVVRETVAGLTPPAGYRPIDVDRLQTWHNGRAGVAAQIMGAPEQFLSAFSIALANQNGLDMTVQANVKARARVVFDVFVGA